MTLRTKEQKEEKKETEI
jgi:hypothetical protein